MTDIKTELTVTQGKTIWAEDIGLLLSNSTKLTVMIICQHFEDWTPFNTGYKIDTSENILKEVAELAKKCKCAQIEDMTEGMPCHLLINGGESNATQTQCTIYNLDSALMDKFLKENPQFEVI